MFLSGFSGHAAKDQALKIPLMINGHTLFMDRTSAIYEMNIQQTQGGTISASPVSGLAGTVVSLSNSPIEGYQFGGYEITGATLTGNQLKFVNSDVTAKAKFNQMVSITYQSEGHGTLTGNKNYAAVGETVTLSPINDTYYRISGYEVTGGTINGNTLTVNGPCTARAVFKVNGFTARGVFNFFNAPNNYTKLMNGSQWWAHYTGGENVPASYYNKTLVSKINNTATNSRASGWWPAGDVMHYVISGSVTGPGIREEYKSWTLSGGIFGLDDSAYGTTWPTKYDNIAMKSAKIVKATNASSPTFANSGLTFQNFVNINNIYLDEYPISALHQGPIRLIYSGQPWDADGYWRISGSTQSAPPSQGIWYASGIAP